MHSGKRAREVSLLGQGEGDAGHAENFSAEISVDRNQSADGDQFRAEMPESQARHVGERAIAVRGVE